MSKSFSWQIRKKNIKYKKFKSTQFFSNFYIYFFKTISKGGKYINKQKSIKEWNPIKEIYTNSIIKTKRNKFIKIIEVTPINYNLKSDLEKKAILNSYKVFLKTCSFNIQILIQSNKENLESHIKEIQKNTNKIENKYLINIAQEYIENIKKINITKKSSSKKFYIIIENEKTNEKNTNLNEIIENELKEKYFKIKENLSRCGNNCYEITEKNEILDIYFSFFNTRKKLNY